MEQETWTSTERDLNRLQATEMKFPGILTNYKEGKHPKTKTSARICK
jgi:hypothetical protein